MAERKLPCCDQCHYCDMPLPRRHEHDHFPIPKSAGGEEVVPACMNCHELKDRMPFEQWSPTFAATGLMELFGEGLPASPSPHALLEHVGDPQENWFQLSPAARILYGKVRAAVEHEKVLFPTTLF